MVAPNLNRSATKGIHEVTNIIYWAELPGWKSGNPAFDLVCSGVRRLPFSGESIVACRFMPTAADSSTTGRTSYPVQRQVWMVSKISLASTAPKNYVHMLPAAQV
jgi:hypothetical protein